MILSCQDRLLMLVEHGHIIPDSLLRMIAGTSVMGNVIEACRYLKYQSMNTTGTKVIGYWRGCRKMNGPGFGVALAEGGGL
ncbi:MAG: hypothetical protein ACYCY8_11600 [Burkholderiales bacterium]